MPLTIPPPLARVLHGLPDSECRAQDQETSMQRRHFLGAGLALPALPALFNTARAAPAYPASPITLIVARLASP
ncbi:hypothetical protein G6F57_022586 [Rhizopus arrhizus]|nr:hypothetical protein G6F57_022586 [Rhizopus arrhizus]